MGILPEAWLAPLPFPGGRALPNRILAGPMMDVSAGSFVTVLSQRGWVRSWWAPFIRISTAVPRPTRLRDRLQPFLDTGLPVVAQLMGLHIERLCGTAERLAALGVAAVDLNCACPSPTVLRNGSGGMHLRSPQWIGEALTALRNACPDCGVTVKLRTGFDSPDEMDAILAAVRAAGPDAIVLHLRTVAEEYRPVENGWDRLARAKQQVPDRVLIASGDVCTAADALALYRTTGVDGVAVARGLLRNPHLLCDIESACRGESVCPLSEQLALEFLRDIAGVALAKGQTRRGFVLMLARRALGTEHPLFGELAACRDLAVVHEVLLRAGHSRR